MLIFNDSHNNKVPIPKNRKIQWRISGYAIVENDDGHVFMVQSGGGLWHFPGGGIEVDEDVFGGIQREYLEETGYKIKIEPQIYHLNEQPFYHTREQAFYHSLQLFFKAHLTREHRDLHFITDHDATRQSSWISLRALPKNEIHGTIHTLVQKLLQDG